MNIQAEILARAAELAVLIIAGIVVVAAVGAAVAVWWEDRRD